MAAQRCLKVGEKEVPTESIKVEESFDLYCSKVNIVSQYPLEGTYHLVSTLGDTEVDVVRCVYNINQYEVVMFPTAYTNALAKIFPPIKGEYTIGEILGLLGMKPVNVDASDSMKMYWELPQTNLQLFMDLAQDKVSYPNGGGVLFTHTLDQFAVVDLKTQMGKDVEKTILGPYDNNVFDQTWMKNTPGNAKVVQDCVEQQIVTDIEFEPKYGGGFRNELLTNSKLSWLTEVEARNQFYRKYYRENVYSITTDIQLPIELGTTVSWTSDVKGTKGVMYGYVSGDKETTYTVVSD